MYPETDNSFNIKVLTVTQRQIIYLISMFNSPPETDEIWYNKTFHHSETDETFYNKDSPITQRHITSFTTVFVLEEGTTITVRQPYWTGGFCKQLQGLFRLLDCTGKFFLI